MIGGCASKSYHRKPAVNIPEEAGVYPKVTEADKLRGELSRYRSCYDVHYYDLKVDVDIETRSITGTCEFKTIALSAIDTLQFDLFKNMDITSIRQNDSELEFYRKHNAVFVKLSAAEGDNLNFTVDYEGVPMEAKNAPWDGGFVWKKDKNDNPLIGVACEGKGASLWWPNKDHPRAEPDSMRLSLIVPDSLTAVGNGRLESVKSIEGKTTTTWLVKNPINNYNITLNIGDYVQVNDTLINSTGVHDLNHYVLSYNKETAENHFPQAREVIHFFEKVYGEYPFWEDGYKLVETPYAGMEHQTAIAYGNSFKMDGHYYMYDLVDYIILHETAHEWWGNSLTACDGADVWLHESFATYSEVLYVEEKLGRLVSIDYLKKKRSYIKNKRPMVGPQHVNYWGFDDVYWKGAWVLHTLRSVINNDTLFFQMIKDGHEHFKHSVVCTDEFTDHINNFIGQDMDYFFKQYLYDRKPPVFEYLQHDSLYYYKWSGVHENFNMPLDILVNKNRMRINPTIEPQSLSIPQHALVEILDKEFYIKKQPSLILN